MSISSVEVAALLAHGERVVTRASLIFDPTDALVSGFDPSGSPVRPLGQLRVSLIEADGQAVTWPLVTIANPSGYYLWFGTRSDGGPPPDPGEYQLRVDSDFYAPFIAPNTVTVPTANAAIPCPLQPGYAYPFTGGGLSAPNTLPTLLRGVAQNVDGSPQVGATVSVDALKTGYLIDASGQFVFVIEGTPPPAQVAVSIATSETTTGPLNVAVRQGATNVVPQTVLTGSVPMAVAGTTVQVAKTQLKVNVASDGSWRMVLPLGHPGGQQTVTATIPGRPGRKPSRSVTVTPGQENTVAPLR